MKIKYPILLEEILFNGHTGSELTDCLGIVQADLLSMLTGHIEITCNTAVKIKRILGSEKPLEYLFEVSEQW